MRRSVPFVFFAALMSIGASLPRRSTYRDTAAQICARVDTQFYKRTTALEAWLARCYQKARRWPDRIATPTFLDWTQYDLDDLRVSHLAVYDPRDWSKFKLGPGLHTGVRSRYVDGHLVIYRVMPKSSAGRAGLRPGDEILTLPGIEEVSPQGASFRAGTWHLARGGRPFDAEITLGPAEEEGGLHVSDGPNGAKVLTIPGFDSRLQWAAQVRRIGRALEGASRVVVDVRENIGGDVGPLLRFLALFLGPDRFVGSFRKERVRSESVTFDDAADRFRQSDVLERAGEVRLVTPRGYPRYDGPVTVLTAEATASAAEIFADAMSRRPRTRVWGWPTSGRVVLAGYYLLPELGFDYAMSVPIAAFYNADGVDLEGHGIRPERSLYHDLAVSLRGEDSWINEASR